MARRIIFSIVILLLWLGFTALVAFQSSETLSVARVQTVLQAVHAALKADLSEDGLSEQAAHDRFRTNSVFASGAFQGALIDQDGSPIVGSWSGGPDAMPIEMNVVLAKGIHALAHERSVLVNDLIVHWYHAPSDRDAQRILLLHRTVDQGWSDTFHVFILPIALASVLGVWALVWLALVLHNAYASEVKARASAERSRVEAEKANQAKSQFLSMMSHEFRTPLNGIIGFAQVLLMDKGQTLRDAHALAADQILNAGNLMLQLVNQILDLTSIEAGASEIALENVDATEVLNECLRIVMNDAETAKLELQAWRLQDSTSPIVVADRLRLKQVFLNLLSNAIKYNTTGEVVSVGYSVQETGRLRFSIIDDGPGICPEQQVKLFKPFERLGMENMNLEGSGIGLSITKKLVELMGGDIGYCPRPGQGSCFWFELEPAR